MRAPLVLLVAVSLLTACRTTTGPDFGGARQGVRDSGVSLPGRYAGSGGVPGGTGVANQPTPETRAQVQARMARRAREAEALWNRAVRTTNPGEAGGIYKSLADNYPEYPRAAEARYREGLNTFRAGGQMRSVRVFEEYMSIAPVNPHLADIEEMIYTAGCNYLNRRRGLFKIFKTDEDGLNALKFVVANFPAGDYADDALMKLADYYRRDDEAEMAALVYKDLLLRYPDSEWTFEARKGLALTYANRDQGAKYNAGFVDRDPRENVPDDPRAEAHAGPVKGSLELAIGQYDRFIERIDRDPGRCGEYALQVDEVKRMRQRERNRLACKDDEVAAYYAKCGNRNAALVYRRSAARWRGDERISCQPLDLVDPSFVPPPAGTPVTPTQPGMPRASTTPSGQLVPGGRPANARSSFDVDPLGVNRRRPGTTLVVPDLSKSSVPPPAYDMPAAGRPQDFSGSSTVPPPPPPPAWPAERKRR